MQEIQELIRQIKADVRAGMNGVAAAAMRDAGMTADYRVNFGVELPRLQELAGQVRQDVRGQSGNGRRVEVAELAQALWNEPVRECRILALLLYPAEAMLPGVADIWGGEIRTVELAQIAALHLFSHLRAASQQGFQWVAADDEMLQILGYYTLIHVVRRARLSERSAQELADHAAAALASGNRQLRAAAQKTLDMLG